MPVDWSKYGGGSTKAENKSASRIDWNKYDPEVQKKQKAADGAAVRAAVPELFNPIQQSNNFKERIAPKVPAMPTALPSVNQQLQTATTVFKDVVLPPTRREYVSQKIMKDREESKGKPVLSTVQRLLEPVMSAVYGLETLPGVSAFQKGAGTALNIETSTAPFKAPSFIEKPAGFAGMIAGSLTNPAALEQGLFTAPYKAGQQVAASKLGQRLTGGNVAANRGLIGAVAGGIQGGAISGVRGETDADDLARNIGLGAAAGLAGDVAGYGLGRAFSKLFSRNGVPDETIQEILALPAPRQRGNMNNAVTDGVITTADTTTPSQPFGLPSPAMLGPTTGRIAQQSNPYRVQFENLMKTAQRMEQEGRFTPGREDSDLDSLWSQMAGRDGVSLDELIQRAYPTRKSRLSPDLVQSARSNQAAREVAGAPMPVRSTSDRLTQPQGVLSRPAMPIERIGRSPQAEVLSSSTPIQRPRTEVNSIEPIQPIRETPEVEVDQLVKEINTPRKRDRVYSYLDEAEKAARGRIAKRRGNLNSNPLPEWADHSIVMAAKVGKGTIKASDFTEELVKEFGESIRPHADRIFRQTKEVLRNQERRATKEGQAADTFNNSGQGDASTFDQKISRTPSKKKESFDKRWEKIRTQFVDDIAPLEGLEKRVTGRLASAEDSLYKTARLYKGTPEKASQVVTTRLAPVIQAVERAGYSADDIGRYALAKHAKDVNAAGYKSGFTNAEIEDVLSKYGNAEMNAAQQELVKINRDMMQGLVDNGVVSKQLADTLGERWQNYIPLFRSFDDEKIEFGSGMSGALANVASPIKALKGSERAVVDPLENMVKNIFQSVNAAERNKVAGQLAKLSEKDVDGAFIRKLKPNEEVGRKNVVNVKVDGENVKYEVEPEVYQALLNLDKESSSMLINVLSKPASLLRAGATLTPEFSLRNPMRDVAQAFITSNSGFNPITDFGAGLIQSISKGKLYQDWIENSGAYGNIISQDRNVHRQALEKVLKQPASKKFVNVVTGKGLINILRAITDTTESATKVGEYRAALRQGQTKQEAAYRSRDIMDFGRAGTNVRQVNKVVAFLNANIQGKSKILRAIKANPAGVTARAFAAVTVPTIGIYALNAAYANETQKQTLAEAPDWQKDSFWLIAIPGTDQVARIPKPFDIAPIFANLPEKALQFVHENDKEAFDGFVNRTIKSSSLPAQLSGMLPFIEGMANYSFFREGPIIPQREQGLQFKDQYDPIRTTEVSKLLAAGADKITGGKGAFKNFSSPRIMDSTIKGLTAGLGTYATDAVDAILQGKIPYTGIKVAPSLVDRPAAPGKRLEQQPLAKAFLVDPLQGGRSMDKFYTEQEKLKSEKASAAINEKPFKNEGRLSYLNDISSDMSDINKYIREIEKSDLTAKEKRDKIEPLVVRRNKLAQMAVKSGVGR